MGDERPIAKDPTTGLPPAASPMTPQAPAPESAAAVPAADMRAMPLDPEQQDERERGIVSVLQGIYDPEIPVNIYELGLIYGVRTSADGHVEVDMTLTSPMCPVAESLPPEVQRKVSGVPGVMTVSVNVVWEPPWEPSKMSEAAKLALNLPY